MKKKKISIGTILIYIIFACTCICIVYPFTSILSVSLTSSEDLTKYGFSIWPKNIDLSAYEYLFKNSKQILSAYGTTILVSVVGTAIGLLVTALYGYVIAQRRFPLRRFFSFFAMFTMFFSGGMAAKYIINVNVLGLKNSIWVLILPIAINVWNIVIMRTYFEQLPYSLIESAKIDGAGQYRIFTHIMFPLAKPALATVALTLFVSYWNSYYEAMMYMDTGNYVTLQLLLHRMLQRVDFLKSSANAGMLAASLVDLPDESLRMATCVLTVLPMLLIFPRFQKYFVEGMAVGSVKG